jgi:NADPH-dependent 2,4-dienoyl-CoA reductase/sulfur reductase-like enzyme
MQWAELAGLAKQATHLPVIYAGRVTSPEQAEQVIAAGHADLVAMARATMADPRLVAKATGVDLDPIRPCIGLNECIHRKLIDGLPYACGVNPRFAREAQLTDRPTRASATKRVLVVGAGPAGSELAAQCAEQGHTVALWERNDEIGGALAVAALARGNSTYRRWIEYQTDRLRSLGIDLHLRRTATADEVLDVDADMVAIATGAVARVPPIPGVDSDRVHTAVAVLKGERALGERVLVVSEDDGPSPLSVSDHLAGLGHAVTLAFQTPLPSPGVGKYSNGGMFSRLIDEGVEFVPMTRVVMVDNPMVHVASTYGNRAQVIGPFDSVVLATGAVPDDALYRALKGRRTDVHLLGDAFAPRRMVFATRQAFELASTLL